MDAVTGPVVEFILQTGVQSIVRQVGYVINYKKILESFERKVNSLDDIKDDIQKSVTAAKRNLDPIKRVVETWLETVEKETLQDEMMVALKDFIHGQDTKIFNHDRGFFKCCCANRHKIGRQAQKKILIIDELSAEGRTYIDVTNPCSTVVSEIIHGDMIALDSQEHTRDQVMAALKDDKTYSVGIYGILGVGKTILIKQVYKQVHEENLFDVVVTINVSEDVNLRKIQDDIAHKLGLKKLQKLDDKSQRASLLAKRLKQEQTVLIIFDDVRTADLDLIDDVGIPYGEYHHKGCKVLISSRSFEVCKSMLIQKNIEVNVLSEEDSWKLFKKKAGEAADTPALRKAAKEVVKSCGFLPLTIDTVGRELRNNKDKGVWEYKASELRSCSNIPDIDPNQAKL